MVKKIFLLLNIFLIINIDLYAISSKKEVTYNDSSFLNSAAKKNNLPSSIDSIEKPVKKNWIIKFLEKHSVKMAVAIVALSIITVTSVVMYNKRSKFEKKYYRTQADLITKGVEEEQHVQSAREIIKTLKTHINTQDKTIKDQQSIIQQQEQQLKEKSTCIEQLNILIAGQKEAIKPQERDEAFKQRDEAFKQRDEALKQRDEALKQKEATIREKDQVIQIMQPSYLASIHNNLTRINSFFKDNFTQLKYNLVVTNSDFSVDLHPSFVDSSTVVTQEEVENLRNQAIKQLDNAITEISNPVTIVNKGWYTTTRDEKALSVSQVSIVKEWLEKLKANISIL